MRVEELIVMVVIVVLVDGDVAVGDVDTMVVVDGDVVVDDSEKMYLVVVVGGVVVDICVGVV